MFVNGQRTLSQREAIAFIRTLGPNPDDPDNPLPSGSRWTIANADNGAVTASKDGSVVLLPASWPRYSVDETERIVRQLLPDAFAAPRRGKPGSADLDVLLHQYRSTGFAVVGVGRRYGPLMPQIREPADDAPALSELDKEIERVAELRWPESQPWYPENGVDDENRDEVLRRVELWKPSTRDGKPATKWRPCDFDAICMWASSAYRLHGQTLKQISEWLEVKSPTVRKAIALGDMLWATFGAWPWAVFPAGAMDDGWWETEEAWTALADAMDAQIRRGVAFVRSLRL
jgi:hypothetical protein